MSSETLSLLNEALAVPVTGYYFSEANREKLKAVCLAVGISYYTSGCTTCYVRDLYQQLSHIKTVMENIKALEGIERKEGAPATLYTGGTELDLVNPTQNVIEYLKKTGDFGKYFTEKPVLVGLPMDKVEAAEQEILEAAKQVSSEVALASAVMTKKRKSHEPTQETENTSDTAAE